MEMGKIKLIGLDEILKDISRSSRTGEYALLHGFRLHLFSSH